MSALIKAAEAHALTRPLAIAAAPHHRPRLAEPSELASLRHDLERLSEDHAAARIEMDRLRTQAERAFEDGHAEGKIDGLALADEGRAESLEVLGSAIDTARAEFSTRLVELERLALQLAGLAITKVLADPTQYADQIATIVKTELAAMEAQSVIAVRVSDQDFPDAAGLADLAAKIGRPSIDLRASGELRRGACHMSLKLGAHEVGPIEQARRIVESLQSIAAELA